MPCAGWDEALLAPGQVVKPHNLFYRACLKPLPDSLEFLLLAFTFIHIIKGNLLSSLT